MSKKHSESNRQTSIAASHGRHPGKRSFGSRNLLNMKRWYLFYAENLHQPGAEIEIQKKMEEQGLPFSEVSLYELKTELVSDLRDYCCLSCIVASQIV